MRVLWAADSGRRAIELERYTADMLTIPMRMLFLAIAGWLTQDQREKIAFFSIVVSLDRSGTLTESDRPRGRWR